MSILLLFGIAEFARGTSPDEIVDKINSKEPPKVYSALKQLGFQSKAFQGDVEWTAELYEVEIDTDKPKAQIVRIRDSFYSTYIFSIFMREKSKWELLNTLTLDVRGGGYGIDFRIVKLRDRKLMCVVGYMASTGTGFSYREETWYKLGGKHPKKVLTYPVAVMIDPAGMKVPFGIHLGGYVAKEGHYGGEDIVVVEFSGTYINGYRIGFSEDGGELKDLDTLFSFSRTATYTWSDSQKRFILDKNRSTCSAKEIKNGFAFDCDTFLRIYYKNLLEMTTSNNPLKKKWLQRFLIECKTSKQKMDLLRKMGD